MKKKYVLIMKLEGIFHNAKFLSRPNRFLSYINLDHKSGKQAAHVPDPGRLEELLMPGAEIIVRQELETKRKTKYSLVGVKKDDVWVNIDSIFTNRIFKEEFNKIDNFLDYKILKSEFTFGNSRFDFLLENMQTKKKALVEVKGATLVEDGLALFPDAPTTRGVKHVKELIKAINQDFEANVVFVVKRSDAISFKPNKHTDPKFAKALVEASTAGVNIIVVKCSYDPIVKKEISIIGKLEYSLK